MKLLIALALAAAPSGLAMAPYVTITDEPTVSPIGPDPSPTNSPTKSPVTPSSAPTKSPVTPSQAPTKAPVASTPTGDLNGCGEACDVVTIKEIPDFRDHGERRGQSEHPGARPASVAPARTTAKEFETQALAEDFIFKCYGEDQLAPSLEDAICDGPPPI